jgi:hypothetical protein
LHHDAPDHGHRRLLRPRRQRPRRRTPNSRDKFPPLHPRSSRFRRAYRTLSAAAFAAAARGHWAIENTLHWVLDVTFREDLSRLRIGHGANNMAVVRHFALNLVRQVADKRSIKRRRKRAAWDPQYLLEILGPPRPQPC